MAILKHITSKNADYGEAQRYLMFQYDEATMKPVLDESGRMIPREEFYLDGINCDPFTFDMECKELNAQYRKNQIPSLYSEFRSERCDRQWIDWRTGTAAWYRIYPQKFPRTPGFSLHPHRRQ